MTVGGAENKMCWTIVAVNPQFVRHINIQRRLLEALGLTESQQLQETPTGYFERQDFASLIVTLSEFTFLDLSQIAVYSWDSSHDSLAYDESVGDTPA
ncbi:unnamed protein product [Caenorhabditis auriculariae]|uniref:Uncharacterized protein n=1 Tax=Caenorhabditis auriculariae TaxID=2777116 RepID=A0A8S1H5G9_9PELO|nr:unnamed protein product [Caenorhabditis auriculariae]